MLWEYGRKEANTRAVLRLCFEVLVRILTVMMNLSYPGELAIIAGIGNIVMNFLGRLNRWRDQLQIGCTVQRHGKWQTSLQSNQTSSTALTISVGIMDHEEVRRKRMGWKILEFFFLQMQGMLIHNLSGKKIYVTELEAYLVTPVLG